jgi:hypothetical protein
MKKRNLPPEGGRPSRPRHEWSPTSNALDPFTGVCSFECQSKYHATVIWRVWKCRCVLQGGQTMRSSHPVDYPGSHSVVARLQFSRGNATRHKVCHAVESKSYMFTTKHPQGRRQETLSDARDFRVGTQTMHSLLAMVCVCVRSDTHAPTPEGLCGSCFFVCFGLVHIV